MSIHNLEINKYWRTPHLQGSALQPGDEDKAQVAYASLAGRYIVVEEKADGANTGLSFSPEYTLLAQSRGHYLTEESCKRHLRPMLPWAASIEGLLLEKLEDRFLMYGEWMYAKHTTFYDCLPHYFLEFDILDKVTGESLSTDVRHEFLANLPIVSVPVLFAGVAPERFKDFLALIRHSYAKSEHWRDNLIKTAERRGVDVATALSQTEDVDLMEGLYIKVEEDGRVVDRLKWVRAGFKQTILETNDNEDHWEKRPLIPNLLAPGVDIYNPLQKTRWEDLSSLGNAQVPLMKQKIEAPSFAETFLQI